MNYSFLNSSIDEVSNSDVINPFILKNCANEIKKAVEFLASDNRILHIHGFLGTGKRQIINYISNFTDINVIKLEYYCKVSTVSDDILLSFIDTLQKIYAKNIINNRISTLAVKFNQLVEETQRPILIILHSLDDITEKNIQLVINMLESLENQEQVKIIISTRGIAQDILGNKLQIDNRLFIKGFSKDIFKMFVEHSQMDYNEKTLENFYKCTRGYYYYTALVFKIVKAMNITLNEFMEKYTLSGTNFDEYLGMTYVNLIPTAIRNFFWFLRTVRHGLSLNALAAFELYDEFSLEYLKTNLMIFIANEIVYVQDYFHQNIDISIPQKT